MLQPKELGTVVSIVYQCIELLLRFCLSSNVYAAILTVLWLNTFTLPIVKVFLPILSQEEYVCFSTRLMHVSFCSWIDAIFQLGPVFLIIIIARKILVGRLGYGTSSKFGLIVQLKKNNIILPQHVQRWYMYSKIRLSPLFYLCVTIGVSLFLVQCIPKLLHALAFHNDDDFVQGQHGDIPCKLDEQDYKDRAFITKHVLTTVLAMTPRPMLFPTYGTVMGYERYRGFLPWDRDVDFGILKESIPNMSTHEFVHKLMDPSKGVTDVYYDFWLGSARVVYKNIRVDITIWTLDKDHWVLQRDNVDSYFFFHNYSLYHTIPVEALMDLKMANTQTESFGQYQGRGSVKDMEGIWQRLIKDELMAKQFEGAEIWLPMPADPHLLIQKFYPLSWWREVRPVHCINYHYTCWDNGDCPALPAFAPNETAPFQPKIGPMFIFLSSLGVPIVIFYFVSRAISPGTSKGE